MVLGLNRVLTREKYVESSAIAPEMAEQIFSKFKPVQYRDDGTALYLESMLDRAVEDAYRPSMDLGSFICGQEIASSRHADALNRIADVMERLGPKEEVKEEPAKAHKEWFTAEEAGRELNRSSYQIRHLCRREVFGQKDSGGKWLIHQKDIERFRNGRTLIHGEVF